MNQVSLEKVINSSRMAIAETAINVNKLLDVTSLQIFINKENTYNIDSMYNVVISPVCESDKKYI